MINQSRAAMAGACTTNYASAGRSQLASVRNTTTRDLVSYQDLLARKRFLASILITTEDLQESYIALVIMLPGFPYYFC
jgi:hypothetical protein